MGCIVFVESCILDNSMYRKDICVQEAASLIFLASTGHPNPLDPSRGHEQRHNARDQKESNYCLQ